MTRSSFDPRGGETERSGSQNTGPDAQNISHLPPDLGRAEVENVEKVEEELTGKKPELEPIQQYRFKQRPRKRNPK